MPGEARPGLIQSARAAVTTARIHMAHVPEECWLLIIFCLAIRLFNLTVLPVFNDEAIYINYAQSVAEDPFSALANGDSTLGLVWLTATFLRLSPDPLSSARLASVLAGTLAMLGLYLTGRTLYSRRVGVMSAALYAVSPLMLFHDRMVLADVLVNASGAYTLLFSLTYLEKGKLRHGVGLGLAMGLGMLSKPLGVFLLFTPLVAWGLVHRIRIGALARRLGLPYVTAGLVVSPVLLHPLGARALDIIRSHTIISPWSPASSHWLQTASTNASHMLRDVETYLGAPVVMLCVFSLLLVLFLRNRRGALLWVVGLLPAGAFAASSSGFLPPRYFLFAVSPLLISAAWGIEQVSQTAGRLVAGLVSPRELPLSRSGLATCAVLLLAVSVAPVRFDYYLLTDPTRAPLPPLDQYQYITGWPSGYGILETAGWLEQQASHSEIRVVTGSPRGTPRDGLGIYLRRNASISIVGQSLAEPVPREELTSGTFFVLNPPLEEADFASLNPGVELLTRYEKPGGASAIEVYGHASAVEDGAASVALPGTFRQPLSGGILWPGLVAVFLAVPLFAALFSVARRAAESVTVPGHIGGIRKLWPAVGGLSAFGDCIKIVRQVAVLLVFLWALGAGLRATWHYLAPELSFVTTHLHLDYDEKTRVKWGDYYEYMVFVRENTSPDATILIPPLGDRWLTTGNAGLDSYWLYPRHLVGIEQMSEAQYALVVKAEDGSGEMFPPEPAPAGNVVWWRSGRGLLELARGS
jgi:hypothetical protein